MTKSGKENLLVKITGIKHYRSHHNLGKGIESGQLLCSRDIFPNSKKLSIGHLLTCFITASMKRFKFFLTEPIHVSYPRDSIVYAWDKCQFEI